MLARSNHSFRSSHLLYKSIFVVKNNEILFLIYLLIHYLGLSQCFLYNL